MMVSTTCLQKLSSPGLPSQKPLCPDLPIEIWVAISDIISTLRSLSSLTCTCRRLHKALFPLLMRKAAYLRLYNQNMTILHWASEHGFIRVVEGLLEAGASVDALDINGASPLMYVCKSGYVDIAQRLIIHGASLDLSLSRETSLTNAAQFNNSAILELLFRNRAEFDRQHWWTILSAANQGFVRIVRILVLTGGVDVNFHFTESDEFPSCARPYIGRTAVHLAVCNQHPEVVAFLVHNSADINFRNNRTSAIEHLINKWPSLSPGEERCLYELCGRNRWRTTLWKVSDLLKFIRLFWPVFVFIIVLLGLVAMIVALAVLHVPGIRWL